MNYLKNMQEMMIKTNNKSKNQWQHGAWDNKKRKTRSQCLPRGLVFKRLEDIERAAWWKRTSAEFKELTDRIGE